MVDIAESVQKLLARLEQKTEEIQAVRAKLHRLESERSAIREQIKGYFAEDHREQQKVHEAQNELLFGHVRDKTDSSYGDMVAHSKSHAGGVQQDRTKALRNAAQTVKELGGEVDARQLATALAVSFDAARLRLARACRAGLLKRTRPGKYSAKEDWHGEDEDITF